MNNLRVGPGNGQCIEPANQTVKYENASSCKECLNKSSGHVWNDTQEVCLDSYKLGSSLSKTGDLVAFDYGDGLRYAPCNNIARVRLGNSANWAEECANDVYPGQSSRKFVKKSDILKKESKEKGGKKDGNNKDVIIIVGLSIIVLILLLLLIIKILK